jgi:UDP-N-acetylglucosamine enolpyruvyl transferase
MVTGIKNSIKVELNSIILKTLKTKLKLCPMVNAVTLISNFFKSLKLYMQHKAIKNNIWS